MTGTAAGSGWDGGGGEGSEDGGGESGGGEVVDALEARS